MRNVPYGFRLGDKADSISFKDFTKPDSTKRLATLVSLTRTFLSGTLPVTIPDFADSLYSLAALFASSSE